MKKEGGRAPETSIIVQAANMHHSPSAREQSETTNVFRIFSTFFVAGKAGLPRWPSSGRGADGAQPESRESFDPLADGETTLGLEYFRKSHKFSSKLACFPVLIGYGYKPHIDLLQIGTDSSIADLHMMQLMQVPSSPFDKSATYWRPCRPFAY